MGNKVLIMLLLAFLGFASCGKENGSEQIPDKEPPAGIDFPEDDGAKYPDRIQRATWFHAALFRIPAFSPSKISYCRRDCINFADYRDY